MKNNKNKEWSWKTGGIALGILSIIAIYFVKPLGVSTQYVISLGMFIKFFSPEFINETAYLAKYLERMTIVHRRINLLSAFPIISLCFSLNHPKY